MNFTRPLTILPLLSKASKKIERTEAEIILGHIINKDRAYILAHPENKINWRQHIKFNRLIRQRGSGVPLAYLTGHKEFFGLDFFVNKNVLIPRPDTEILVESAIAIISNTQYQITLIDIGTGSGCIPISILKTLQHKNIEAHAIDISKKALRVAKKNAEKHNVKINFHQGDLLAPILRNCELTANSSEIIITANLPYLTQTQFDTEPSIKKEPKLALIADNKNGLSLYEKLLKQLQSLIFNLQSSVTLLLEIDPSQTIEIKNIIQKLLPTASIIIKKDLAGHDRVVIIQLTTSTTTSRGTI